MKKSSLISIVLFGGLSIIASFIVYRNVYSIDKQINRNVASLHQEIAANPSISSNPYHVIEGNKAFDRLVRLGEDALPILESKLAASADNGLEAYVLAIAIERIAKVDLKSNESTFWDTPEKFLEQWSLYKESNP